MTEHSLTGIPLKGRIQAFDFLRFLMIFFIILLHAGMSFMKSVPSWWYVINDKISPVFTVIVNVLDIFPIPVLFFLSGYFAPSSFLKKRTFGFIKDKFLHIVIPWILGMLFIKPLFYLFYGKSIKYAICLMFSDPYDYFFSQAHFWYLSVLSIFLLIYVLYENIRPLAYNRKADISSRRITLLIGFIILSAICFFCTSIDLPSDRWTNIGYFISFKPSKIASYIGIFTLGIYAWKHYWFTDKGWIPQYNFWRFFGITSVTLYMLWKLLVTPNYNFPTLNNLMESVLDSISCFSGTIYILLFGIKYQSSFIGNISAKMASYSYGIYWVHLPVSLLFLYFIVPLGLPIFIKFITSVILTLLFSWLLSRYVLKTAPFLKRIF